MVSESMEKVDMYNLWLVSEGQHMFYFCPVMMGILVITATLAFFDIWLFKRRALQMRLATFCMTLLVAWYIAYGVICYMLSSGKGTGLVDDLHSVLNPNNLLGIELQTTENPYMGYIFTIAKQL